MKISFGAKLLTTPEQFVHKTDTPEQRENAVSFVHGLKLLVENPVFDEFTRNDTIQLKRTPSKKGHFNYQIFYNSPEINDIGSFQKIIMQIGDKLGMNEVFGAFEQISYAPMYKRGAFSDQYSIFDSYEDLFQRTFNMSFSEYIKAITEKEQV